MKGMGRGTVEGWNHGPPWYANQENEGALEIGWETGREKQSALPPCPENVRKLENLGGGEGARGRAPGMGPPGPWPPLKGKPWAGGGVAAVVPGKLPQSPSLGAKREPKHETVPS